MHYSTFWRASDTLDWTLMTIIKRVGAKRADLFTFPGLPTP
jgi:hypothetical protein